MLDKQSKRGDISEPIVVPSTISKKNVKKVLKEKPSKVTEQNFENNKRQEQPSLKNQKQRLQERLVQKEENVEEQTPKVTLKMDMVENSIEKKRGRGRPKKVVAEQAEPVKEKRGRGRPRKQPVEDKIDEKIKLHDIEDDVDNSIDLFDFDDEEKNVKTNNEAQNLESAEDIDLFDLNEESESTTSKQELDNEDDIDLFSMDDDENEISSENAEEFEEDEDNIDFFDKEDEDETSSQVKEFDDEEDIDLFDMDDDDEDETTSQIKEFDNEEDLDLFDMDNDDEDETSSQVKEFDNGEDLDLFDMDDDKLEKTNAKKYEDETDLFSLDEDDKEEYSNIATTASIGLNDDFSRVIAKDKKVVCFVGTTKNGTSFVVNNLAELLSSMGISTAILDMTKSKNAYYIYTNNEENLRKTAANSISKLKSGIAEGVKVNRNLTIYTDLPGEEKDYSNVKDILETLTKNYSVVLIDCDFNTSNDVFEKSQEIYLVQSMDVLTIQPLTAFLRNLKSKGILKQEKIKIVINKEQKIRSLSAKTLIGGIAFYNDPAMSYMTELFDREKVPFCSIPFEMQNYARYLEALVNCSIQLKGYTKTLMTSLKELANMVYPLINRQEYSPRGSKYKETFSPEMNNTLNKMKNNY